MLESVIWMKMFLTNDEQIFQPFQKPPFEFDIPFHLLPFTQSFSERRSERALNMSERERRS